MNKRGIQVFLVSTVILISLVGAFYLFTSRSRSEYSACENELAAIAPKLRLYAHTHKGKLPATEAELASVIGHPLSRRFLLMTAEGLRPCSIFNDGSPDRRRPYIIDRQPHPYYFEWLGYFPLKRVHMLLNDLTVYHATSMKDFT